ncbi:uncharacterized protein LOC129747021 [Uranotaenia lowii]|uniref:uncharacterized protein LOC129747021 n=1 Tax=Uranotaenia lowii TaxID=190385 RepID=UPI00247AECD9|nr:uncharacterized protein LOC129747021 [Uranotaenia lowii]
MDRYCRLCRRSGEFESISIQEKSRNHPGELLTTIIENCLQLRVDPSDGLPKRICHMCQAQVEMFHLLRKISFQSEYYFREMLQQDPEPICTPPNVEVIEKDSDGDADFGEGIDNTPYDESSSANESYLNPHIKTEPEELLECNFEVPIETDNCLWIPKVQPNKSQTGKPKMVARYGCMDCPYRSPYRANVSRHIKLLKHSGVRSLTDKKSRKIRQSVAEILANSDSPRVRIFSCQQCGYKSTFKTNVDRHQRGQHHVGIDVNVYDRQSLAASDNHPSSHLSKPPEANSKPLNSNEMLDMVHVPPNQAQEQSDQKFKMFNMNDQMHQHQQHQQHQHHSMYPPTGQHPGPSTPQTSTEHDLMREFRNEFMRIGGPSVGAQSQYDHHHPHAQHQQQTPY